MDRKFSAPGTVLSRGTVTMGNGQTRPAAIVRTMFGDKATVGTGYWTSVGTRWTLCNDKLKATFVSTDPAEVAYQNLLMSHPDAF